MGVSFSLYRFVDGVELIPLSNTSRKSQPPLYLWRKEQPPVVWEEENKPPMWELVVSLYAVFVSSPIVGGQTINFIAITV
jgi:hypothetical protein